MKYAFIAAIFFLGCSADISDPNQDTLRSDPGPPVPRTGTIVGEGSGGNGVGCPTWIVNDQIVESCWVSRDLRPVFDRKSRREVGDPPPWDALEQKIDFQGR